MPVAGPPVNLLAARAEFGLGAGGLLQLLKQPNGVVPATPANSGVPTSAPIGLLSLAGATAQQVQVVAGSISALTISPADASASVIFNNSGQQQQSVNGSTTNLGPWLLSGSAASFEIFATLNSGTLTSGTTGAWLNMGSTLTWTTTRTNNAAGTTSGSLTFQIRPVAGSVAATGNVTLSAQVEV